MLLRIIRYIKGYIRIRITGYSTERFLNACSHKGIFLWGLQPVSGAYEMNISVKGFRQLKPMIRKTGTKVAIVRRFGLPFFLHKYRKRKLFFGGAMLCAVLMILMSRYIWNIDISGNLSRTDEVLLDFLKDKAVQNGMPKSKVDCARIVKDIRKEYDDIIWVSASIQGTRLMIQVKENEDSIKAPTEISDDDTRQPTDIVADQDCVITEIITRQGVPMVQKGMEVKQGDILVSGQVPVNNDAAEVIDYQYHESDADIWGQTAIEYQDDLELFYDEKSYSTVEKMEYFIEIGKYHFGFFSIKNQYELWEMYAQEHQVKIGENFYLPITYGSRKAKPYESTKKKYSQEEVRQILSEDFNRYCEDLQKKGVEIIENGVKIYTGSKKAEAKGRLTVVMPIGEKEPSQLLEIPVREEQDESGEE